MFDISCIKGKKYQKKKKYWQLLQWISSTSVQWNLAKNKTKRYRKKVVCENIDLSSITVLWNLLTLLRPVGIENLQEKKQGHIRLLLSTLEPRRLFGSSFAVKSVQYLNFIFGHLRQCILRRQQNLKRNLKLSVRFLLFFPTTLSFTLPPRTSG